MHSLTVGEQTVVVWSEEALVGLCPQKKWMREGISLAAVFTSLKS